ncbi:MAG: type IV secretion protein IcmS [Gammaproteobacteria bacterium]|nr:type IV secretion protein IcmS [Gammaproteobacteria bacterium]
MAKKITDALISLANEMGIKFFLRNKPISHIEVFSETGLLPAIAKRADQLASLCFGYGIGVVFDELEGTMLGSKVVFDDSTPDVLRYLCIADVLHELAKTAPSKDSVPLDELLYD